MPELHEYQERALDFAIDNKATMMLLPMGLGKTAIALNFIREIGVKALVVAPLRPCYTTWPEEIIKWTPELSYTVLHGPDKQIKLRYKRDIYIINYEGLKWFMKQLRSKHFPRGKFLLILDESTFLKDPSTIRFKTLQTLMPLWYDFRMCLTATPSPKGLHNLWSQVYMLDEGERLERFYSRYKDKYFLETGAPRFKIWVANGCREKIYSKIQDISFYLKAEDYLEMPEYIYNEVKLKMPPRLARIYKKFTREFILRIQNTNVNALSQASLSMKLRQFVQGGIYTNRRGDYEVLHKLKINALKEVIESAAGSPVLVPIQFKFEVEMIQKALGRVPVIHGATSTKLGNTHIRNWNKGEYAVMLCHPLSIGHGTNLQTGGNIVLWYSLPWSWEQYYQLNGRLYRQGQLKKGVIINHILMSDTVDDVVLSVLKDNEGDQQQLYNAIRRYAAKVSNVRHLRKGERNG